MRSRQLAPAAQTDVLLGLQHRYGKQIVEVLQSMAPRKGSQAGDRLGDELRRFVRTALAWRLICGWRRSSARWCPPPLARWLAQLIYSNASETDA